MTPPTTYRLDVVSDANLLAKRCSEQVASLIDLALDERDRAHIALSGGSTPAAAYRLLNREHLPWSRVDVVLGDERWVSASDPASNARMLAETLLNPEGPGGRPVSIRCPPNWRAPRPAWTPLSSTCGSCAPGIPPAST